HYVGQAHAGQTGLASDAGLSVPNSLRPLEVADDPALANLLVKENAGRSGSGASRPAVDANHGGGGGKPAGGGNRPRTREGSGGRAPALGGPGGMPSFDNDSLLAAAARGSSTPTAKVSSSQVPSTKTSGHGFTYYRYGNQTDKPTTSTPGVGLEGGGTDID